MAANNMTTMLLKPITTLFSLLTNDIKVYYTKCIIVEQPRLNRTKLKVQ